VLVGFPSTGFVTQVAKKNENSSLFTLVIVFFGVKFKFILSTKLQLDE
jgi:hypothetical protein